MLTEELTIPAFYRPTERGLDEMMAEDGSVRAHWQAFATSFAALSPADLARRWEFGQTLLQENGVTYNVYGDPAGLERPWQLDPLPVILSAGEWAEIERAVVQRASLLEAVIADLYGQRRLIRERLIPPSLLHANPNFLRPLAGTRPPQGRFLDTYAVELARTPNGGWQVVADRTEVPAGTGYALENRTIVSRVLPEFFRAMPVRRLGPFFDTMRATLRALSPRRNDDPRIVLMTPGPYNETYFEHAFLARHLGLTLVQGEDLTVRDNKVFLKTLTGLQQVDVIVRRTTGEWCDPLELRGDSTLGVAGLVQAARTGTVAVVNTLGSGLLDGSAIMPFLPGIAHAFLGQDLLFPSVPSWWCGQDAERETVLDNLERLVLRPAFHNRTRPVVGAGLDTPQRQDLIAAIRTRPWDWVAQEMAAISTVPVWTEGGLESQHMVIRLFAMATEDGWTVMPGGLARVSPARDLLAARLQSGGGGSKDVWVLSDAATTAQTAPRAAAAPVRLTRGNRDLPSRVADNMFWLGRYVERCEIMTRKLRAAVSQVEEALDQGDEARAAYGVRVMGKLGLSLPAGIERTKPHKLGCALMAHHGDQDTGGLASTGERLGRVVAHLRDRLSVDTWRALQQLRDRIVKLDREDGRGVAAKLNTIILTGEAVSGLAMENMTRGPLWLFLDTGRRVERAITVVDTTAGALSWADGEDDVPLDLLLEISDSTMTYRSRYLAAPRLAGVMDLLLADETNPRSLAFQLEALSDHMDRLAALAGGDGFLRPEQRQMTVLCGIVRTLEIPVLSSFDIDGGYHDAERLLENIRSRLWGVSETLTRQYFTHAQWRLPTASLDYLP